MVRLICRKVNAGTLAEVIVALLIIMLVFTMGSRIYLQLFTAAEPEVTIQARQQISVLLHANEREALESTRVIAGITYVTTTAESEMFSNMIKITITATWEGRVLAQDSKLIAPHE